MVKFNFKRSAMLLGAAAVMLSAGAAGTYRDVTGQYMKNPAFLPGWQGALTDVQWEIGEVFNGAFNLYQVLPDMPAGEYILTVNAFYRCGWNEYAKENMVDGKNYYASIYLGTAEQTVEGLFDNGRVSAPDNLEQAKAAFEAGEYVNTVTYNHEGGDLILGIKNLGGYVGEWCAFDNFILKSGDTDYTDKIVNANFAEGLNMDAECWNMQGPAGVKKPDVNRGGGVYRKTNASPYNFGQQVDLPAGTYRFSALTFLRYGGAGDYDGKIITCKGAWGLTDSDPSPKQWYEQNLYNADNTEANAYLYMSKNETKPANIDWEDEFGELNSDTDKRVRLLGPWEICEGDYASMPENETRGTAEGTEILPAYDVRNVVDSWCDSGMERESAAAFANDPEKWRQYIEFTLEEPAKVWVGLAKNANSPAQYWNPFADFKLEVLAGEDTGVESAIATEDVAPVYYNLQGVRVANPSNGIFIVKKGNKTSKQVIK
ncbi:MAG: hypothetical protein K2J78_08435 [Muribaculaceae bacterium]|nr:hypothetical protein [Muribaculaceae bacterium]